MPIGADISIRVTYETKAAAAVLLIRDRFNVRRIHAGPNAAQVIELRLSYLPPVVLINQPVGPVMPAVVPFISITFAGYCAMPNPAPVFIFGPVFGFKEPTHGLHVPFHSRHSF